MEKIDIFNSRIFKDTISPIYDPTLTPCWLWIGAKSSKGYAIFKKNQKKIYAHRFSYEFHKGSIDANLHIDHLCRVHHCVNPEHLEAVTPHENARRGFSPWAIRKRQTKCVNGHDFNEMNTYFRPDRPGQRNCRACNARIKRNCRKKPH